MQEKPNCTLRRLSCRQHIVKFHETAAATHLRLRREAYKQKSAAARRQGREGEESGWKEQMNQAGTLEAACSMSLSSIAASELQ